MYVVYDAMLIPYVSFSYIGSVSFLPYPVGCLGLESEEKYTYVDVELNGGPGNLLNLVWIMLVIPTYLALWFPM